MVKKIKVCGSVFDVKYVSDIVGNDNSPLWGEIQYDEMVIKIDKDLHIRQQTKSLLHEIVHAISSEHMLDWNEKMVIKMTNIFQGILIDNKQFFKDVLNGS